MSSPPAPDQVAASPVPARLVTAPHRALLTRGPDGRQFGLSPGRSVAVEGLPAQVLPLVDRLRAPAVAVEWVAEATERGVPPEYAAALLGGLVERGVLVDAEIGPRTAARRAAARVRVCGEGPLAAGVALGLARAGIGAVEVAARGHVESADVGCGGLRSADIGRPRSVAATEAVERLGLGTNTGPAPSGRRPDLVVLTDAVVPDPAVVAALRAEGVDHLPVFVRDGAGVVGPLVLVERSPCLGCVERWRAQRDPAWPRIAAQLAGRSGSAEPEAVVASAALGAAQVLVLVDGRVRPPSLGASLELDPHTARLVRRPWTAHPGCPCGWARRTAVPRPRVPRAANRARATGEMRRTRCAVAPEGETIME
ncbi:hypothetical protein [Pseudonocardia oroxyli]|uniref:Bacteriocin biosynthesis cyclodehydratase domain-containing protein n=1 Tax=Pseudonocardia oroxyli TaxID=366584 RepID=A0A1G7QU40_PSEOR|nr:hypothetical protein [Pseudonocardia oroxyli]SDG02025.1 bacteriocin biosynthesis cyclodehydratase domain-containing protein [Pseudonocardia oroxyli]